MGNVINHLEDWIAGQKDHLILWIPVFLGTGAALYFGLAFEPPASFVSGAWFLSALLLVFIFSLRHRPDFKFIWFFLTLALFATASGFMIAKVKTALVHTPTIEQETRPVMVQGKVVHVDVLEGRKGTLVILDDVRIENFPPEDTPAKLRLTSRLHVKFNLGGRVEMLAKLMPSSASVMPGAYDFRRHYYFDSIGASGFILKSPRVLADQEGTDKGLFLEEIRRTMGAHIARTLSPRLSGIATALITGERAAILDEDWDALRYSGLAHIISISGLHVVLVAAPIFFFFRLFMAAIPGFALRHPIKKYAAAIALLGAGVYVALVAPTVPTYRALLMTAIGLIAIMLDRSPFSLRLVSFAAIVVLVLAPESIWSASFQLSFGAVISLVLAAEWTRAHWSKWRSNAGATRKFLLYLGGSMFTTLVVSFITAPLAAYHFQQIPVYSVIANALCIPLTGLLIMPAVIGTFVLWPFGFQDLPIRILGYGVEWMLAIAQGVAAMPGAVIHLSSWPLPALAIFTVAGLMLYLFEGKARMAAAPVMLIGMILIFANPLPVFVASAKGSLFMVRDGDALYISSLKREKFAAESWIKRLGGRNTEVRTFPKEGAISLSDGSIACGNNVCRIEHAGRKISFGTDYAALDEDCSWADIIVTSTAYRNRRCKAVVKNRFTLMDSGALTIDKSGRLKTVAEDSGRRPWVPVSDRSGSGWKARPGSEPGRPSRHAVYKNRSQAPE